VRFEQKPKSVGERSVPSRCISKHKSAKVGVSNGKKVGVAGSQRPRGKVEGKDVAKMAGNKTIYHFLTMMKSLCVTSRVTGEPWTLWQESII
jgi:hypothetical protein